MYQMLQQRSLPFNPSLTTPSLAVTSGMSTAAKSAAYAMLSQGTASAAGKNETSNQKT